MIENLFIGGWLLSWSFEEVSFLTKYIFRSNTILLVKDYTDINLKFVYSMENVFLYSYFACQFESLHHEEYRWWSWHFICKHFKKPPVLQSILPQSVLSFVILLVSVLCLLSGAAFNWISSVNCKRKDNSKYKKKCNYF